MISADDAMMACRESSSDKIFGRKWLIVLRTGVKEYYLYVRLDHQGMDVGFIGWE